MLSLFNSFAKSFKFRYFITSLRISLFSAFYIFSLPTSHAQVLPMQWQKCYGGTDHDMASSVIEAHGEGFLVFGYSMSDNGDHVNAGFGSCDFWAIKTDNYGGIEWEQPFGGSGCEFASNALKTSYGYVLSGNTSSSDYEVTGLHGEPFPHSSPDFWVVGIDTLGNILWENSYGGSNPENLYSITPAIDGGFAMAGLTISNDGDVTNYHGRLDGWIVKINDTGAIVWGKAIGGTNVDIARAIKQTRDRGYIVAGQSNSDSTDSVAVLVDFWLVKMNDTGGVMWQQYYGGTADDWAVDVLQATDGGYLILGNSKSNDGDVPGNHGMYDYWLLKVDKNGIKQWSKNYGGSADDNPSAIIKTLDGGYAMVGSTKSIDGDITSNNGLSDIWVVKINDTGAIQWQRTYGGTQDEFANSITQTADSGYIIAGEAESVNGNVGGNHGKEDYWVFRLDKTGVGVDNFSTDDPFKVYPIPANEKLNFSFPKASSGVIKLMDLAGRVLVEQKINNVTKATFEVGSYSPGLYYYEFKSDNLLKTGKVVIEGY